jgi:hypothetical protein
MGRSSLWHGPEAIPTSYRSVSHLAAPGRPLAGDRRSIRAAVQWWQAPGAPSDSAVLNEEPHPQAATALGLLTVKPAPISVST